MSSSLLLLAVDDVEIEVSEGIGAGDVTRAVAVFVVSIIAAIAARSAVSCSARR